MHWELDDIPAILIIVSVSVVTGVAAFSLSNANLIYRAWRQRRRPRVHGPWCAVATRPPFGIQILYQANTLPNVTKWRTRNRASHPKGALGILTRDEVDIRNAAIMASEAYWEIAYALAPFVDQATARRVEVGRSEYTTPTTAILTIPALAQARVIESIEGLITDSQLLSDGIRTLKRRIEIPNE